MGKGSLKEKNDRHSRILGILRAEEICTSKVMCELLDVSLRTLMRDIQELRDNGYPIDSDRGRGGGLRLSDRFGIDKLNLNHDEVIDMLISLAITEKLKSPLLGKNLRSIRQKISRSFPPHQREVIRELRKRIFVGDPASQNVLSSYIPPSDKITSVITDSFFNRKIIQMEYFSAKQELTKRQIEPSLILLSWPVWYLLGWDYLREDFRVFRIDRISNCQKLDVNMPTRDHEELIESFRQYFESL